MWILGLENQMLEQVAHLQEEPEHTQKIDNHLDAGTLMHGEFFAHALHNWNSTHSW